MDILLDTGFLVALIIKPQNQQQTVQHETAKQMLKTHGMDNFHTVWECVTEACHLLSKNSRQILLKWMQAFGVYIHASQEHELPDMAEYMAKYSNVSNGHGADFADVALVFLAARLKTTHIFTIDKADFETYRTRSGKPFNRLWVKN
ncbi:MAG: type II toxin-antitoxin system VapC family toxin [Methylovulum sp.]|jgi:predicted nucleic acid-binding protein